MKYKNTDFNADVVKGMTATAFKKEFEKGGYHGKWDEAFKLLGGKA